MEEILFDNLSEKDARAVEEIKLNSRKSSHREVPLDVIYTIQGADGSCCLAVQAGLRYGIQSDSFSLCPNEDKFSGRHKLTFIDNNYFDYDHERHLSVIKKFRPKYATVRDLMTEQQCEDDDIEYYSFEQIIEWAEELGQYAENVIIIPKYDVIDKIPDKFVLGYSIPTSHGGTPLPAQSFQGHKIHLLGGSWKKQLSYLNLLGEDVVSVDNNQIQLIANKYGSYVLPDGSTRSVRDIEGDFTNPRYIALALSFGNIAHKVQEMF